jgi:hypothetical protein
MQIAEFNPSTLRLSQRFGVAGSGAVRDGWIDPITSIALRRLGKRTTILHIQLCIGALEIVPRALS